MHRLKGCLHCAIPLRPSRAAPTNRKATTTHPDVDNEKGDSKKLTEA
jgi:hypothetical protein